MARIVDSPFEWLEFDKEGTLTSPGSVDRINQTLADGGERDLVIISHGWNNDRDDAWQLYWNLWKNTSTELRDRGRNPSSFVVAGILWPAIKWRDNFDLGSAKDHGPSGMALSANGAEVDGELDELYFRQAADDFVDLASNPEAAEARDLAVRYADDEDVEEELMQAVRRAIDEADRDTEEDADLQPLEKRSASELLGELAMQLDLKVGDDVGEALGVGDTVRNFIAGRRAAAGRLFNYLTYYTMKKRAGVVGRRLGAEWLAKFNSGGELRIHLVGHSFGARLVTAAVSTAPDPMPGASLQSLTMLQGAFSHNALASEGASWPKGAFEGAHRKVKGPVVITHTHNDKAVTLAYAIASRLARDNAKAIGDKDDEFGAIGANGALHLDADYPVPPAMKMSDGANYMLTPGKVHNMLADACIKNHGDVAGRHAGRLLAFALS